MNFLGVFIVLLIGVMSWNWDHKPELRCESALRQIKAHDMCRLLDECDVKQSNIAWDLYWEEVADESCGAEK